jgi:hypothetical protein
VIETINKTAVWAFRSHAVPIFRARLEWRKGKEWSNSFRRKVLDGAIFLKLQPYALFPMFCTGRRSFSMEWEGLRKISSVLLTAGDNM